MNKKYTPHTSSFFDVNANVLSLCIYLVVMIGSLCNNFIAIVGWLLPLVILLLEKKSPLVYFHAVQCLVMQIVVALLNGLLVMITFLSAGSNLIFGFNIFAIVGITGLVGLALWLVSIAILILEIIAMIKAWEWEAYALPIFGSIANKFYKDVM